MNNAFATYLDANTSFTIGQDLYIGTAPTSPDAICWVIASGGDTERKLKTGERMKSYLIEIRYRNRNYQTVYDTLQTIEELLNADDCPTLIGFDTVSIEATTFPIDEDLDSSGRKIGLVVVTISTYSI